MESSVQASPELVNRVSSQFPDLTDEQVQAVLDMGNQVLVSANLGDSVGTVWYSEFNDAFAIRIMKDNSIPIWRVVCMNGEESFDTRETFASIEDWERVPFETKYS